MANEIITTLHPDHDPNTNLYPNIKKDNIPDQSIDYTKLEIGTLGYITPQMFGALGDGVHDDTLAIQSCFNNHHNIFIPKGTYKITSTISINDGDGFNLFGEGYQSVFTSDLDIVMFEFIGTSKISFENVRFINRCEHRIEKTMIFNNVVVPIIRNVYFDNNNIGGKYELYIESCTGCIIEDCVFNHSSILLNSWDTKIDKCYIWALSQDYGILLKNGVGNTTITNTDIVPPLQSNENYITHDVIDDNWDIAKLQGGIVIGEGGQACTNVKMSNIYIDGNPQLITGRGIIINANSFEISIDNFSVNQTNDDVIIIDSSTCVSISKGLFYNCYGVDCDLIRCKKTGIQGLEDIYIDGNMMKFTDTSKTLGCCINCVSNLNRSKISNNFIDYYGNTKPYNYSISLIDYSPLYELFTNMCKSDQFHCQFDITIPSGSTGYTIQYSAVNVPYTPKLSCYNLHFDKLEPVYRIQIVNNRQIWLAFESALSSDTLLSIDVKL